MLRSSGLRLVQRKKFRNKPSENTPAWDKGPVEWLPRPVRMPYQTLDELRDWVMRRTLDNNYDDINAFRNVQREWGQHPPRPVLGDFEPKFPKKVYKDNHVARKRFLYRWHRANSPMHWLWLPRTGQAPERRGHASDYPENWKVLRDGDAQRIGR
jgi:hypothetical protein